MANAIPSVAAPHTDMEAESPKKEKRKRQAEGVDEGHKRKKHKHDVVEDVSVNGAAQPKSKDGSERHKEKKMKKKHKDHKNREQLESNGASSRATVAADLTEVRKEKKKHGDADAKSSAVESNHEEKEHKKKKRKKDEPVVQDIQSNGVVDNAAHKKKEKRKDEKRKEKSNAPQDTSVNEATVKVASREESHKEKKRKKHRKPDLATDEPRDTAELQQDAANKRTNESIRDFAMQEEQFFAPANYVGSPAGPKPFEIITSSLRVPIPPVGQSKPLDSVCANSLSPMILQWSPEFKGVVFAYRNPKLVSGPISSDEGTIPFALAVDEYAAPLIWIRAEFVLFKPQKGTWLDGHINLQNESFIGFVLWNVFTGTIERKRLPKDWIWIEDEEHQDGNVAQNGDTLVEFEMAGRRRKFTHGTGHFEDGDGNRVSEGSKIKFRLWDFEPAFAETEERHFLTLEGSMLTDEEETALGEQEQKAQQRTRSPRVPVAPRRSALRSNV